VLIVGISESAEAQRHHRGLKVTIVIVVIALGFGYINQANYALSFRRTPASSATSDSAASCAPPASSSSPTSASTPSPPPRRKRRTRSATCPSASSARWSSAPALRRLFAYVLSGIVNYKDMTDTAIYDALHNAIGYDWLGTLVVFGILGGYTSVILVMLLGQSRVFFSMSRDGLLPKMFSDIHPKFRTPWRSNLVFMVFVSLFSGFVPLSSLGDMTSIGTLLAFVIVCAAS
jgi:APA family basic amino acid/polyamine antiporter